MRQIMKIFRQGMTACRVSMVSLRGRKWASINAVMGTAAVVGVLVALLSIAEGYEQAVQMTGSERNALVLRSGARSELESSLDEEQVNLIKQSNAVGRTAKGEPLAAAETYMVSTVADRRTGEPMNIATRGVEPSSFQLRDGIHVVEGRMFKPGEREAIVGRKARERFEGLDPGSQLRVADGTWRIVGVFEAGGALSESEVWMDRTMMQSALQRLNVVQVVMARLADGDTIEGLTAALQADPRLSVTVTSEADYYGEQSDQMSTFVETLAYLIGSLMALGAVFAALNTGHAAVAARSREIAVLIALGIDDRAIVLSVIGESLVLALLGAGAGAALAYGLFDGRVGSTLFFSRDFSQVIFAFTVTGPVLIQAAAGAAVIGLVAGIWPAWGLGRASHARSLGGRP